MALILLVACSDGGSTPLTENDYPTKGQSMSVNPPVAEILETGQKVKLEADVRDALGKQISGASVKWEALDPSVATVDFSGTVTGMNEGVAEIRGTFSGLSATAIVAVSRPNLRSAAGESVTVYPDSDTIATVGGVLRLLAVGRMKNGKLVGSSKLAWSSTNTSVATVDKQGDVTGRKSGTTLVVVQNGAAADTAHISVAPTDVATSIVITPRLDTIPVIGSSVTLGARVLNGSNEEMENRAIGWISLDPSVATVSSGVVLGVKKGTARIVASHSNFQDTARVVVAPVPPVTSLYLTPKTDTIPQVGGSVTLKATLLDGTGATVSDQVTWGTMDPGVASVTQSGAVKGVTVGVARITAKYNALVDTARVWVSPPAPAPTHVVATTPATHAMAVGATVEVEASIRDSSGQDLAANASWTSLDATVATVSTAGPIHGVDVKAIKVGTARIVAQYGGAADTTTVTVTGGANGYTARLTPDTVTLAVTDADVFVDWFGYDASGKEVTSTLATWTSADPSIATVPAGPAGHAYVKAISPGVTQIVATWNGTVVASTIIVGKAPGTASAWVEVTPSTSTIASAGESTQLGVAAKDADGTAVNSSQVTWKSLDPATAAVNGTGLASGVAQGTARIVAQYSGAADTASVTVLDGGTGGNGYTARLTPDTVRVTVSGPDVFVDWFGYDANGNEVTTSYPTWISVDPLIATVPADPGGHAYVKAISAGVTQVAATWNGVVVTATVIVQSAAAGSAWIQVSPSTSTISSVGDSTQLSVAAKDTAGNTVSPNLVSWQSLDPATATVNGNGLVNGTAKGTARIVATYTTASDTAEVVVAPTPPPPLQPSGSQLTPANLRAVLGPLVARNTSGMSVIQAFDLRFEQTEQARFQDFLNVLNDPQGAYLSANHYGGLRSRLMWAIRNNEPYGIGVTDESQYVYARGRRILKRYLEWTKANGYAIPPHNNTGVADVEALYVLEGDQDALTHIHVTAMAATWDPWGYLKFQNSQSDARQVAISLQLIKAAHRLGIPYERNPANHNVGFDTSPGSWYAAGRRQIDWARQYAVQSNGAIPSPAHGGSEAYLFNALLATQLLEWCATVEWDQAVFDLARLIMDHLIAVQKSGWSTLGYLSSSSGPATDLASFYVWPSLAMWQETGDQKYYDFAMKNVQAANTAYISNMKQWNQVYSTLAQGAEALLTGNPWR
ncbi:MAG TPA: Ig-like domain-containing protein [Longimicrobiales bacterium]|nr:Ig-like domain-containing protein [Longimicrobiales bacterium]